MKKITILTLFESLFDSWKQHSIINNAIKNNKVEVNIVDFRKFANNKHKSVDDYQYGGGPGMVLMLQPIVDAIRSVKTDNSLVILTTPKGEVYSQQKANYFLKSYDHLIIIAGHYEGFDERIVNYIDMQISVGDYVLTGGEIPAMIIADSVIRLVDNVISKDSLIDESFENYLLDYPVYTKPREFEGHCVPEVLLSGNHKKIADFRKEQQIKITKANRSDLYNKYIKSIKKGG